VIIQDVLSDFEGYFLTEYRDRYPNEPYIPYEKRTAYDLVDDYEKLPGVRITRKGALRSQPQVIKFTSYLPMVGGSLRVLRLLPPLKLVAMIPDPIDH
jgi:phosphohistidine swiveling domain-containing protein